MIIIQVTRDDIVNGRKNDCGACPVALALLRLLTALNMSDAVVNVFPSSATVYGEDYTPIFHMSFPSKVYNFIYAFDKGNQVEPFEIEMVDHSTLQVENFPDDTYGFFSLPS